MNIDIQNRGAFGSALVTLQPGETLASDSGSMFRASANIDMDVCTRAKSAGGILAGIKRVLGADSFFISTYKTNNGEPGEVGLAPTHMGQVRSIQVDPSMAWMCAGGSYLGSSGLETEPKFQGIKGFFTGESIFYLRASGQGQLLTTAFGRMEEIDLTEPITVDTGHVVAFHESLAYTLTKAGKSWMTSWLAGEGFVMNFTGRGKLIVQSHNAKAFGEWVGPRLPRRKQ